ncbi:MAG: hypothetical protein KAS32_12535 [Candidatus Peribacteraceae bacterium]|nr:hypothetical protein [Candidatus Peribacteraceae bacterium]
MSKVKKHSHQYTKEEIRKVLKIWEKSSVQDIADELGVTTNQVQYLASQIRKAGVDLPKKKRVGHFQKLILEIAEEEKEKVKKRKRTKKNIKTGKYE